jgi:hypothetical protein
MEEQRWRGRGLREEEGNMKRMKEERERHERNQLCVSTVGALALTSRQGLLAEMPKIGAAQEIPC